MGKVWKAREAEARFSELLETAVVEGPQIVSRRGVEAAALVPIEQWRELEQQMKMKPDLKDLLLAPGARTETLTPPRSNLPLRATPDLE